MQTPQIRTKFTANLQIHSFSPCNYILEAELTFMRVQNAQFIWAYIHAVFLKCIIQYMQQECMTSFFGTHTKQAHPTQPSVRF